MIHLKSLHLSPYGAHVDRMLKFAPRGKITLVYGPNEAGKSTLMRAIETFFFGFDHKSRFVDNHQFADTRLKLIAEIQTGDQGFSLSRTKTKKLLDIESRGGEAMIPSPDHRSLFQQLFALDGERLRIDAERLLSHASLGENVLNSAMLGSRLEQLSQSLESKATELFSPRGRTQPIVSLKKQIEEIEAQIKDHAISYDVWRDSQLQTQALDRQFDELESKISQERDKLGSLEAAQAWLNARKKLADVEEALGPLAEIPILDADKIDELEKSRSHLEVSAAKSQEAGQALRAVQDQLKEVGLNDQLWNSRIALERAQRCLDQRQTIEQMRPEHQDNLEWRLDGLSKKLSPVQENEEAWAALSELMPKLEPLRAEPKPPTLPIRLKDLSLEQAMEMVVGGKLSDELIDDWRERARLLQDRQRKLELAEDEAKSKHSRAEAQVLQLKQSGAGVEFEQVLETRRKRDLLWNDLKRDPSQGELQAKFEHELQEADRVSESYAKSERHSGAWSNAQEDLARATLDLEQHKVSFKDMVDQGNLLVEDIRQVWPQADDDLSTLLPALAELSSLAPALKTWREQQDAWDACEEGWDDALDIAQGVGYDGPLEEFGDWFTDKQQAVLQAKQLKAEAVALLDFNAKVTEAEEILETALADLDHLPGKDLLVAERLDLLKELLAEESQRRSLHAQLSHENGQQQQRFQRAGAERANAMEVVIKVLGNKYEINPMEPSSADLREKARLSAEKEQAEASLVGLQATDLDFATINEQKNGIQTALEALLAERDGMTAERATQTERLRQLENSAGTVVLSQELAAKKEALARLVEKYLDYTLKSRVLRHGLNHFLAEQETGLLGAASQYFRDLTDSRYQSIQCERNRDGAAMLMAKDQEGDERGVEALSDGTKDQLLLSLRLASLDTFGMGAVSGQGGTLPMICDDLLIHFDDMRAAKAFKVLSSRTDRQQVMYFTHHQHLCDLAMNALGDEKVEILSL